ncbi:MAG: PDZ domain-containing protein [Gammaproteobacteria bacterium]|nr:PDZ domain-containing protein [Gammaproteobacteria bacterium]NNC96690.1 PDZ domain-containing protein [Gammaproteobacteria bacterium]NNM13806.1 PDZ domain-containing protein [Gammaproteobacteria bacterium]
MLTLKKLITLFVIFGLSYSPTLLADANSDKLAEAQKKLEEAAREYAELSSELGGDAAAQVMRTFSFSKHADKPPKARLGINIGKVVTRKTENGVSETETRGQKPEDQKSDGVHVMGVSPEGPAAQAGLKAGDVITALNGQTLLAAPDNSAVKQLTEIMSEVNPGDTVEILYQRDGVTQSAKIVTDEMPHKGMRMRFGDNDFKFGGPGMPGDFDIDIKSFDGLEGMKDLEIFKDMGDVFGEAKFIFMHSSPLGDAELVELSEDLGEYFGSDVGLLVVKAPSNIDIELRDGDVIRSIDGRTPTSVSHAMRIFRSYEAGEAVNLEILRKKRKRKLSLTIPENEKSSSHVWDFDRHPDGLVNNRKDGQQHKRIKIIKGQDST